jgi:hypothetical protein
MVKTDLISSSKLSRTASQHIIAATWASRGSLVRCIETNVRPEAQFLRHCVIWSHGEPRCSAKAEDEPLAMMAKASH